MKTFAALLFAAVAAPLAAQYTESIEVRVTNVDVVVTDKQGHPVPGLKRDDFTILEDGKPQPITNFYEVRPEAGVEASVTGGTITTANLEAAPAPPPEVRKRRIIIFIDNYTTHPFRRNDVFRAIDKTLATLMRPGDEAELAVWYRGLRVVQPFTSDPAVLRKALTNEMSHSAGMGYEAEIQRVKEDIREVARSGMRDRRAAYEQARSMARAYQANIEAIERNLLVSVQAMVSTLGGLEGKKVVIYAGGALPEHPGLELFQFVNTLFGGFGVASPWADAGSSDMPARMEKLAKAANANGVTMYMLDASSDAVMTGAESNEQPDPIEGFLKYTNTAQALAKIADMTGGIALTSSHNFEGAVQTVTHDLESYYSLGYRSPDANKPQRRIEVKVRNPALRVRARQSYVARSAEEQASDRVVANIYHPLASEIPVNVQAGTPVKKSMNRYQVPVTVIFPSNLTLLPQEKDVAGGFTVYIAVGDADGAMSDVSRIAQPVRIPADKLATFRSRPIAFTVAILTQKGKHTLSVGVVDQVASTAGFARSEIDVR
jgi:VWFA-related protein